MTPLATTFDDTAIPETAATSAPVKPPRPLPPFYYDTGSRTYLVPNSRGGWVPVNDTATGRELRRLGISPHFPKNSFTSPMEDMLSRIQTEQDVAYAGPLAGYAAGIETINARRILVTDSPNIITAKPGKWPQLRRIFTAMLADDEHDQLSHFLGWLKCSRETLTQGVRRPGQALALAGPADSGKSLVQWVITQFLGGREARPYRYMTGATPFNRELFSAEHLVIEDDNPSTDLRARRNFGAKIKEMTVNGAASCHGKNREAISLTPFWRLSITVNDEPENLMMLPPLDESLRDKLILLRVKRPDVPLPQTTEERPVFQREWIAELPALAHFLEQWEIPERLRSTRFGIAHFLHPELSASIDRLAPEAKLLELIDGDIFSDPDTSKPWIGSAEELERHLSRDTNSTAARKQAEKLFSFNTACGVYLGRLRDKLPERFSRCGKHGRKWTIQPPPSCEG